jgi:hypothetical protein
MHPVSAPTEDIRMNEGKGRRRAEQMEEAQEIYERLILQRKLAADLIHRSVKLIDSKEEAATAHRDLFMISSHL